MNQPQSDHMKYYALPLLVNERRKIVRWFINGIINTEQYQDSKKHLLMLTNKYCTHTHTRADAHTRDEDPSTSLPSNI